MTEHTMEKRQSPRLNLNLNVEFLSESEPRNTARMGTTHNVSSGGAYFMTSDWNELCAGQELGLRLTGLAGYGTGPLFRSLRARGTVLRVDPPPENIPQHAGKAGVAVSFSERPCFEVYRWIE